MSSSLHTNEAARVNFTRLGLETSVETSSFPFMEGIAPPHTQESGWTGLSPSHESPRVVAPTWECPESSPAQDSSGTQLQEAVQKQIEVLLRGAERKAQHMKEEAYAAGFATGEEQGFEAGQQRLQATLEHLGQALQEVGRLRSQLFAQSERELQELCLAIARKCCIMRRASIVTGFCPSYGPALSGCPSARSCVSKCTQMISCAP